MALTSLQVCMDSSSSDWLQGTSHEASPGMDTSSPCPMSPTDVLGCSRPLSMERRLRPPHDQSLKCPRCESTHTKFCYYNNYSLTQPRYFCKTCRRYWTKGGTLRNIPVGGGCRKNKKPTSASKKNDTVSPVVSHHHQLPNTTDLQLSFPLHQSQYFSENGVPSFMPMEFTESKLEGIIGNSHHHRNIPIINSSGGYDFMGNNAMVNLGGLMMMNMDNSHGEFHAPLFGDVAGGSDACQRMMMPFGGGGFDEDPRGGGGDVKPKLLSLDNWQQDHHQGSYNNNNNNNLGNGLLGGWSSSSGILMNNYGHSSTASTSTTNPLV